MISVIVPARDSRETLPLCLRALGASDFRDYEVIVVDDASTDDTAQLASDAGARVVTLERRSGPAAARNRGASAARGDVLLFVDADVVVHPGVLSRVARTMADPDGPDAVFGSYDDDPPDRSFFSLYKNLSHHYVHQTSEPRAQTFWGGCGAVRRQVFLDVGGFNEGYERPSIEDIDLGYRMVDAGHSVALDRELLVTHLKSWTFRDLVSTDFRRRALPWARLMLRRRSFPADLNLRYRHRLSVVLLFLAVATAALSPLAGWTGRSSPTSALITAAAMLSIVVAVNAPLYAFFARRAGAGFAVRAVPMHLLYYLYSGIALAWALLRPQPPPRLRGAEPLHRVTSGDPPRNP